MRKDKIKYPMGGVRPTPLLRRNLLYWCIKCSLLLLLLLLMFEGNDSTFVQRTTTDEMIKHSKAKAFPLITSLGIWRRERKREICSDIYYLYIYIYGTVLCVFAYHGIREMEKWMEKKCRYYVYEGGSGSFDGKINSIDRRWMKGCSYLIDGNWV